MIKRKLIACVCFSKSHLWPALAKQGTSRQRQQTDLRFNTHQQCRLVINNQLDQYFQFVKDILLEEVYK